MSKNTDISELINYISVNGSGHVVFTTVPSAASNTDKFLVSDSGVLKYRTAAQLLSDIGAQASGNYQTALTNPVTGTGTANYLPKFIGSTSIANSLIFDNGTNVLIGTTTAPTPVAGVSFPLSVTSSVVTRIRIDSTQVTPNSGFGLYANSVQKWSIAMFGTGSDFTIYNDALLASAILVKGASSNVLIGYGTSTADTGFKLDINGTGRFSSTLTSTSLTTGTSSGSSVNITTNGNNGTSASPLQTNLNFYGFNSNLNGQIRVDDIAGTSQIGTMKFYTWNSSQVLALTLSQTGAASFTNDVTANRYRGINSLTLNTYTTVNPSSNVYLYSQPNDRDSWIYLDSADTASNWGIYHRQIDTAVAGLPANSIGFIGGGSSTLQGWISLATGQATFNNNIAATSTGVDGTFADAFVGRYNANNNETNAIQTAVSSAAGGSGFRFQASLWTISNKCSCRWGSNNFIRINR